MRNLSELNINEVGNPVRRSPPTSDVVDAFQAHFGIALPEDYLKLLRHSNGGHPELDSIQPVGRSGAARWAVNRFYHLDDDRISNSSLWVAIGRWRHILGASALPFAVDGGGNQFFFDLRTSPPKVKICVHDENFLVIEIAPSFEAFVDALSLDPDMI